MLLLSPGVGETSERINLSDHAMAYRRIREGIGRALDDWLAAQDERIRREIEAKSDTAKAVSQKPRQISRDERKISTDVAETIVGRNSDLAARLAGLDFESPETLGQIVQSLPAFRASVIQGLPKADSVTVWEFRESVDVAADDRLVAIAPLVGRERVGVVFGLGLARAIWGKDDAESFKIQTETDTNGVSSNYLVQDSGSQTFPAAITGVVARFRDRSWGHKWAGNFLQFLTPTAIFATAQVGYTHADGAKGGVALGFGWQVVDDVHLLIGYNATRFGSLRPDLRVKWNETNGAKRLLLPSGETVESIRSNEVNNGIIVAIAVPVALKSLFYRVI
jgi:hypothetical protein